MIMGLLIACVIGAVCGFLAGQLLKGRGLGLVGVNQIIGGTIGAVLLLIGISFVKKNVA